MNELTQMPREPEAFGEQVAKLLQRHYAERAIALAAPLDLIVDGKHVGLESLYRMVLLEPERGVELVETYLDRLVGGCAERWDVSSLSVAKRLIMPRIHPLKIFDHLDKERVAYIPFVNDTVVVFVLDMPQMTESVTINQMRGWGLDLDELDEIARQNLRIYEFAELEFQFVDSADGGRAAIVARNDGYDAARLLLPSLRQAFVDQMDGDCYVAIPARDMFLALTFRPTWLVERIRARVRAEFKRMPYPISDRLFVVTRDGIAGTEA